MKEKPADGEIKRQNRLLEHAVQHPVRRDILRRLGPSGSTVTAAELQSHTLSRSSADYHLAHLEHVGAIEVAETMHEGGRVIRVFRSTPAQADAPWPAGRWCF